MLSWLTRVCQSGLWAKSAQPSLYRYVFTSSTTWTVPDSVKTAYISLAGGGGGGLSGLQYYATGSSGGYLLSRPVDLVPGQSIPITIGGAGAEGSYGGTTSFGSYFSCTGGSSTLGGPSSGGNCGSAGGEGAYSQYVIMYEPDSYNYANHGGYFSGAVTPLGYGSGGGVGRCAGCSRAVHGAASLYTNGIPGRAGVVFLDVLY
ncbi:glycine-rich domain-containing protein [Polaromonas aquatica]|uniref:Glycine-rich domain-containing protein n=1 Tax=Polaromonas aquatica TaxID=332657 RepID=A0ABW1TVB8_9BURK